MSEYQTVADIIAERDQLRAELAASQAREAKLREALLFLSNRVEEFRHGHWHKDLGVFERDKARKALSIPSDDTTLREMIEAARVEEQERIIAILGKHVGAQIEDAIRASKG